MTVINKWQTIWSNSKLAGAEGKRLEEETMLKRAIWLAQKEPGVTDLQLGIMLLDLVDCLEAQGTEDEVEKYYMQALGILIESAKRMGVVPTQSNGR